MIADVSKTAVEILKQLSPNKQWSLLFFPKEMFVEYFAKEAYKKTVLGKRKTIQKKDLGKYSWGCNFMVYTDAIDP